MCEVVSYSCCMRLCVSFNDDTLYNVHNMIYGLLQISIHEVMPFFQQYIYN